GGGFGTLPTGANASTNDIQRQEFYTLGTDLRLSRRYEAFGSTDHVLSAGMLYYHSDSPREEKRGTTGDALDGAIRKDSDRQMNYFSLFMENVFKFGPLSVTPGFRLENIWQGIQENSNLDKTTAPLADESDYDAVPFFGVGAAYEITPEMTLYGNWSESYRPKVYADAVPLGTNQVVNGDLDEGEAWQGEAGLRGRLASFLVWDASVFHMEFDRQTGTVGNTIQNVGDAEYDGTELAMDLNLTDWLGESAERGSVHLFYNLTYLDAVFVAGPSTGLTPQYAPDYTMKAGIEYSIREKFKARLGGTFLDDHFGEDTNNPQRYLSSYKVWDLMLESKLIGDSVSVFAGINNLFNERYFAR
ncbi:MAG: TonB-dependent receptor, partial [Phycisphaerales bacterium]|nr:TonB-dependent receptor [Phycisphaerales bacterium]